MKTGIALALFSAATAVAVPALVSRQEGTRIWQNEDGGNIQVSVGDGKLNFGHVVPSSALEVISEQCAGSACKPNQPLQKETLLVTARGIMGITTNVELTVEGQFAPEGNPGDMGQLVGIAKSVMQELYSAGVGEREEGVPYRTKPCQQTPTQGCRYTEDLKYVDQWVSTDHVNVQVRNEDGDAIAGFLNIAFSVEDDGGAGDGVCGAVAGFATILAGAVNGVAGQGMGLLGLFCIYA